MENKIEELIKNFYSKNGIERKIARYELVKIGKPAVEYLSKLLKAPKEFTRWEAIKTLGQIGDPESIPVLIDALENEDFDIRWMAAEALIGIGEISIKPILKAVIAGEKSIFLLEGVHHILKEFQFRNIFCDDAGLINKIENHNLYSDIALAAGQLLVKY
ncbi:MAG: HEAT repeat domain-containing protein [Ignavibacteriaceae bacterium]